MLLYLEILFTIHNCVYVVWYFLSVGDARKLPVVDQSVELITVACAAHWFDPLDQFYDEVKRVLIPGGCLAMFCFNKIQIVTDSADLSVLLNKLIQEVMIFKEGKISETDLILPLTGSNIFSPNGLIY